MCPSLRRPKSTISVKSLWKGCLWRYQYLDETGKGGTVRTSCLKLTWIFPKLIFVKDITTLRQHFLLWYEPISRLSPLCPCPSDQRALQQFRICMSRNIHDKESEGERPQPLVEKLCKKVRGEGEKVETTTKKGSQFPKNSNIVLFLRLSFSPFASTPRDWWPVVEAGDLPPPSPPSSFSLIGQVLRSLWCLDVELRM